MSAQEIFSIGREVALLLIAIVVFLYGLKWRQDALEKRFAEAQIAQEKRLMEKLEELKDAITRDDNHMSQTIDRLEKMLSTLEVDMRQADNYIGAILHNLVTDVEVLKFRIDQHDKWKGGDSKPRQPAVRLNPRDMPSAPSWMQPPMRSTGVENTGRHAAFDPDRTRPPEMLGPPPHRESPHGPLPPLPPRPGKK